MSMIRYVRCIDIVIILILVLSRRVGRRVVSPLRGVVLSPSWVLPLMTPTSTLVTPRISLVSILVWVLVTLVLVTLVFMTLVFLTLVPVLVTLVVGSILIRTFSVILVILSLLIVRH